MIKSYLDPPIIIISRHHFSYTSGSVCISHTIEDGQCIQTSPYLHMQQVNLSEWSYMYKSTHRHGIGNVRPARPYIHMHSFGRFCVRMLPDSVNRHIQQQYMSRSYIQLPNSLQDISVVLSHAY